MAILTILCQNVILCDEVSDRSERLKLRGAPCTCTYGTVEEEFEIHKIEFLMSPLLGIGGAQCSDKLYKV